MHYLYVLKSKRDNKLYIGITNDLRRRLEEHNNSQSMATKYRGPFELIYYEAYRARSDGVIHERKLKQFKNSYNELLKRLTKSLIL